MSAAAAPSLIRWHLSKTETLPFHFGFHEKKPLTFEYATTHRNSLKKLDQHFILLRQLNDVTIVNQQALDAANAAKKQHSADEHKYGLAEELTAGGGKGAVEDGGMYEKELVDQAAKERPHESLIASAKTFGAENATYDNIDEPVTVAAIDQHLLSPHAAHAAADADESAAAKAEALHSKTESIPLPPPKDDILNLPAKDETLDLANAELIVSESGVPVVMPVAEPVEPTVIEAVKEVRHPERLVEEEQEEAERAAALGAMASGNMAAIEHALLANAAKTTIPIESDTTTVQMPLAEPVGTTVTTSLHAPHPSLVGGDDIAESLAAEQSSAAEAEASSLDQLRAQHEAEAAAAKEATEQLDSTSMSQEERDVAELELMSRTKRLAALHERIIRQQTLEAQGPDVVAIRHSPNIAPTTASSRIMEIQQLHLAAQAESAVTHTVVDKQLPLTSSSAQPARNRTKELTETHEQLIKDEAAAAGKTTSSASTASSSSSPRDGGGRKGKSHRKR